MKLVYSAITIRLGVKSFHINQYKATNVNHSTTKSQLAAELGPAQPQLVNDIHYLQHKNSIQCMNKKKAEVGDEVPLDNGKSDIEDV